MLDKNISMDDVHFAIKNSFKKDVICIYSDLNSDKLIFRIRLVESLTKSNKQSLDQSDEIYMLKNIQDNLLDKLKLRVVEYIDKFNVKCKDTPMLKGEWIIMLNKDEHGP